MITWSVAEILIGTSVIELVLACTLAISEIPNSITPALPDNYLVFSDGEVVYFLDGGIACQQ